MLSPGEIAQIKAEIERLEKLHEEFTDSGIKKLIEAWIEAEKKEVVRTAHALRRLYAQTRLGFPFFRVPPFQG